MCWDAGTADASASPGTCHVGILDSQIAGAGVWAVSIGGDGRLTIAGEINAVNDGPVPSLVQARAEAASDRLNVVWAYAVAMADPACPTPSSCSNPTESTWLSNDGKTRDLPVHPCRRHSSSLHGDTAEIIAVLVATAQA